MKRVSRESYSDTGWTAEWDFDPILAIGGGKHGELLPKSTSTFGDLMVHKPMHLRVDLYASTAEPAAITMPSLDDTIERYRTHRFMVPSRRPGVTVEVFPVYVEASMPLDDARAWLLFLVSSIRLLLDLAIMGQLDYLLAVRKLEQDAASFEEWATFMRKLHQLRDEMDGL